MSATHGMIDAAMIEAMRPGAVLANTARGELVDETALITALQSGHLTGAALDTYAVEPLAADAPLRHLPNVVLSPHVAGQTRGAVLDVGLAAARAILDEQAGRQPAFLVNPKAIRRGLYARQGASRPAPAAAWCVRVALPGHTPRVGVTRQAPSRARKRGGTGIRCSDRRPGTFTRSRRGCQLTSPPLRRPQRPQPRRSRRAPRFPRVSEGVPAPHVPCLHCWPRRATTPPRGGRGARSATDTHGRDGVWCARPRKSRSRGCGPRPSSCALARIVPPLPLARVFNQCCVDVHLTTAGRSLAGLRACRFGALGAWHSQMCVAISSVRSMTA
jgi:hypothetical protein